MYYIHTYVRTYVRHYSTRHIHIQWCSGQPCTYLCLMYVMVDGRTYVHDVRTWYPLLILIHFSNFKLHRKFLIMESNSV